MRKLLLVLVATLALTGVAQVVTQPTPAAHPGVSDGVRAQIHWLEATLDDADAAANQSKFPEGELFTWEFWSLALFNVAEESADPADVARALREARKVLPKMDAMLTHRPFDAMAKRELRGGICWFAGQNFVRGRLVALAGERATKEEVARFHADSALLAKVFAGSKTAVLEAHPGMSWPVDSLFGFSSLQIHDRLYGTRYAAHFEKWKHAVESTKDKTTGLHASFLHLDGRPRDVPRGCALSWSLAVLPSLDPELSKEQWARYKKHFFSCSAGVCFVREFPKGVDRKADVDSGPIINGYGMSATAFALAAARANGDTEVAAALERLGETFGAATIDEKGKRYLGGSEPMFDVMSLWVRTVALPPGGRSGEKGVSR